MEKKSLSIWKCGDSNHSLEDLCGLIKQDEEIYIGTDSQPRTYQSIFVTTICIYNPIDGVRYYWKKEKTEIPGTSIYQRLFKEINDSISIALEINKISNLKIEIHADLNSNPKYASFALNSTAKSMVEGCGFRYRCKPHAWAASSAADWHTK